MGTLLTALVLTSVIVVPTQGGPQDDKELIWGTIQPLECGIERVVPMESLLAVVNLGNGLESYMFSTDGDKQPDFEMLIPEGDENRHPLFYRADRNYDGLIDVVYVDDRRDGSCEGIRVYWTPKMEKPSNRHQGTPIPEGGQCDESHHGEKGKEA